MSVTFLIVCGCISTVFSLITFFALAVTKEMKNLQGFMCRCYSAPYFGCMIIVTTAGLVLQFTDPRFTYPFFWYFFVPASFYTSSATIFWLNVMSIDIWMTFRKLRSSSNCDLIEREDAKIVCYSIYAWGGSLVHLLTMIACADTRDTVHLVFVILIPIIAITVSNIYLLITTGLMIKQRRRETAGIGERPDELYGENIEWFIRYVELFVMMMFNSVVLAITMLTGTLISILPPISITLQSILTCVIFLRKGEVRRSLRNYFQPHLRMAVHVNDETS